jgi:hypothetical protein
MKNLTRLNVTFLFDSVNNTGSIFFYFNYYCVKPLFHALPYLFKKLVNLDGQERSRLFASISVISMLPNAMSIRLMPQIVAT